MVLYNEGRVRLHLILGEGAGFWIFYFCAGKYLYSFIRKLSELLRRTLLTFFKPYAFIFGSFVRGVRDLAMRFKKKISDVKQKRSNEADGEQKKDKKINLFGKIHLKNRDKSV